MRKDNNKLLNEKLQKIAAIALCPTAPEGERNSAAIKYFDTLRRQDIKEIPSIFEEQINIPIYKETSWHKNHGFQEVKPDYDKVNRYNPNYYR